VKEHDVKCASKYTFWLIVAPFAVWLCHLASYLPLKAVGLEITATIAYRYYSFFTVILTIPLCVLLGISALQRIRKRCTERKVVMSLMIAWSMAALLYAAFLFRDITPDEPPRPPVRVGTPEPPQKL